MYSMQIIYSVCDNKASKREVCGFVLACSTLNGAFVDAGSPLVSRHIFFRIKCEAIIHI